MAGETAASCSPNPWPALPLWPLHETVWWLYTRGAPVCVQHQVVLRQALLPCADRAWQLAAPFKAARGAACLARSLGRLAVVVVAVARCVCRLVCDHWRWSFRWRGLAQFLPLQGCVWVLLDCYECQCRRWVATCLAYWTGPVDCRVFVVCPILEVGCALVP